MSLEGGFEELPECFRALANSVSSSKDVRAVVDQLPLPRRLLRAHVQQRSEQIAGSR
jgi:hypothetical protein